MAGPPGEPSVQVVLPRLTEEAFISKDNYAHPLKVWLSAHQKELAVIIAVHGFNDYSNAFVSTGEALSPKGITVYAYDQRGFGDTAHRGYWHGKETLTEDLRTLVALVRERHPGRPLFILGDSMGGAVTLKANAVEPLPISGMILVAPAVWGRETMPWYQRFALWLLANTTPWAEVSGTGLNIRASDNDEMLRQLGEDPLVIQETRVGTLWGLVNLMDDALAASARLDSPALLLYGKHDQIIPENAIREMIQRLPDEENTSVKIAVYENGYHMLLRDLQGQVVIDDIESWIKSPSAVLPSSADLAQFDEP